MANSAFSNLSSRASGTLSGARGRFGGAGAERASERFEGQARGRGYREPVIDPYDDIDDVSGIGEVRTRAASSGRYHPPLLSFKEARANSYVDDRLRVSASDRASERARTGARRFEHPASRYTPRVREAVNMGHSSSYDEVHAEGAVALSAATPFESAAPAGAGRSSEGAADAMAGARGAQPVSASGRPLSASGFDPFASLQGSGVSPHGSQRRLKVMAPTSYAQAADVVRGLKTGDAVVLVLGNTPAALAKRILDFAFGAATALDARVECVAEKVFVVARGQELSESERAQLRAQGVIV